jgi:hypothetical protein
MNLNYPALKLLYISILIVNIKSYVVIPLKSTDDLYFSKLSKKYISINDKDIINEIFHKYIFNVLYTDLIIGEPNQKSTAFILQDNFGFYFYEEFSTKELKELGYDNYLYISEGNMSTYWGPTFETAPFDFVPSNGALTADVSAI